MQHNTFFSSFGRLFHRWPRSLVTSPKFSLGNSSLILSLSSLQYRKKTLPGPLGALGSFFLRCGLLPADLSIRLRPSCLWLPWILCNIYSNIFSSMPIYWSVVCGLYHVWFIMRINVRAYVWVIAIVVERCWICLIHSIQQEAIYAFV